MASFSEEIPRISARMNAAGESVWAVDPLRAYAEPCFCDACEGAPKMRGEPCHLCGEPLWGCAALGCWRPSCGPDGVEYLYEDGQHPLSPQHPLNRGRSARQIQALWRGHATRKSLAKKKAEEIAVVEKRWRIYDEKYRIYVVCQTLAVELNKDDALWDASATPWDLWMLEVGGPWLADAEDFLRVRGWRRPQNEVRTALLKRYLVGVFLDQGFSESTANAFLSIVGTFKVPGEWEKD
jgi:hypothetical protein